MEFRRQSHCGEQNKISGTELLDLNSRYRNRIQEEGNFKKKTPE